MIFRLMSVNIKHGADHEEVEHNGLLRRRWDAIAEIIRDQKPTAVCLQEGRNVLANDQRYLARMQKDSGMRVLVGRSRSGSHNIVAFRQDEIELLALEDNPYDLLNGYAGPRFTVDGLPVPLVVISGHLSCYSVEQAAHEAQTLAVRAHGGAGIMALDANSGPIGDPEPDWERLHPHLRMIRAIPSIAPGHDPEWRTKTVWRGNPIVSQALARCDMVDVAAHLADLRGDPALRAHTGVNGGVRIDQFHVTAALKLAIAGYWWVDMKDFTDHRGIVTEMDTSKSDLTKLREFA
ncbi:hypothetical protein J5X84_39145 [Streptosporangiaceae bacterium NEAU-GS5]|nr:hypothetical protein [Streptosporangiaceae bacterium NEAU-GS5]